MQHDEMIKEYQCPGCMYGPDPASCSEFEKSFYGEGAYCKKHVLGTNALISHGFIKFALGLPKGFNRPGYTDTRGGYRSTMRIALVMQIDAALYTATAWDKFNIPVWYLVKDGVMFVRTFSPRVNNGIVEVIEGGSPDMFPEQFTVIDVAEFYDAID